MRRPSQERQTGRAAGWRAGGRGRGLPELPRRRRNGHTPRPSAGKHRPHGRRRKRERQRARDCWRLACMWDTYPNVQTNRYVGENGTGHVDKGTTHHTDTVKDMATGIKCQKHQLLRTGLP